MTADATVNATHILATASVGNYRSNGLTLRRVLQRIFIARYMLRSGVCLSQTGVQSKRLNRHSWFSTERLYTRFLSCTVFQGNSSTAKSKDTSVSNIVSYSVFSRFFCFLLRPSSMLSASFNLASLSRAERPPLLLTHARGGRGD